MNADPAKALAASDKVVASLVKVEKTAVVAGNSITNAFGAGARDSAGRLIASSLALENSFKGIAQAIAAELSTLDRLNGANRQLERDLIAIDSLFRQGKVSASQYAAEMERIAKAAPDAIPSGGNPQQAMSMIGFGGSPQAAEGGGVGGAMNTGAQMALGMAGVSGMTDVLMKGMQAWADYEHAQDEAFNSLRKYYESAAQTIVIQDAQTTAAIELGVSVGEQVAAFGSVVEASEGMHLTTLEQIDATKTLGEVMQMNNKPVAEAGNVMKQLQLAMEVGTLTGGQFKMLLREYPDLIGLLEEKTGKSSKELYKLAQDGKFGTQMLKEFGQALTEGDSVHEKYNDRIKTGSAALAEFIPGLREALDAHEAETRVILEAADAYERLGKNAQKTYDDIERRNAKVATVGSLAASANLSIAVGAATTELAKHKEVMDFISDSSAPKYFRILENAEKMLKAGTITQLEYNLVLDKSRGNLDAATHATKKRTEAQREWMEVLRTSAIMEVGRPNSQHAAGEAAKMGIQDEVRHENYFGSEEDGGGSLHKGLMEAEGDFGTAPKKTGINVEEIKKMHDAAKDLNQELTTTQIGMQALVQGFGDLAGTILQAAKGAEVSWSDAFEKIADKIAEAVLQAMILSALTGNASGTAAKGGGYSGGILGAIFGGAKASGGAFTAPGGASGQVPVLFMMDAGETANFSGAPAAGGRSQGQQSASQAAPSPGVTVVNQTSNGRDLVSHMRSPEGEQVMHNYIRQNRDQVRRLLGVR